MNTAKQQYQLCAKIKRSLHNLDEDYYKKVDLLNKELLTLLHSTDLHTLTKKEILHVISMCSSHRPAALHSIFIYLSAAYDTLSGKK